MSGTYEDLEVWRAAMELVVHICRASRQVPKEEMYGLSSQN
jgi:four helix bundle protein